LTGNQSYETNVAASRPGTVFIVFEPRNAVENQRTLQGKTINWLIGPVYGNYAYFAGAFVAGETDGVPLVLNKPVVCEAVQDNATSHFYLDGVDITVDETPVGNSSNLVLGSSGQVNQPFDGLVFEVILYDRILSDSERKMVRDFLADAYQSYVTLLSPGEGRLPDLSVMPGLNRKRNRLMALLEKAGISTRQGTHAVHTLSYYREKYGLGELDFPNALLADRLSMALPLYWNITQEDVSEIVGKMEENWGKVNRDE
jgi:hypothetical protein